jgi:uncharacterized protein YndB with AHSA1/START domain
MNTQTLSFTQIVQASPAQAFRAFTNAMALREWLCDVSSTVPRPGGRLYLWWNSGYYTAGEFIEVQPNEKISFTWQGRGEPGQTQVEVTLTPRDGGALVAVEHSGIGMGEDWTPTIREIETGWKTGLENLASALETGEDLRFVRRPMLGVIIGDLTPEKAGQLGIPGTDGVRLDGVVEDMGAAAAGLQKDDVITRMGDTPIERYSDISAVLQKYHAGDKIEVEYNRGPQKMSTVMELSKRPIPEIPWNQAKLARSVQQRYAEMEKDLDKLLDNVDEQIASFQPGPQEWNVKQVLAHLIEDERFSHEFMRSIIAGQERFYDDYGDTVHAGIEAIAATLPSLKDLIIELKRSYAETIAFLERIPDDFVAHKASYWRVAHNYLDSPYHFYDHIDQMRAAMDAARQPETV